MVKCSISNSSSKTASFHWKSLLFPGSVQYLAFNASCHLYVSHFFSTFHIIILSFHIPYCSLSLHFHTITSLSVSFPLFFHFIIFLPSYLSSFSLPSSLPYLTVQGLPQVHVGLRGAVLFDPQQVASLRPPHPEGQVVAVKVGALQSVDFSACGRGEKRC